jgi:molybdopterin synthase catalytic subunit
VEENSSICQFDVRVQQADFDLSEVYPTLRTNCQTGAVVMFVGLVRDMADSIQLLELSLEHYPAMTQAVLDDLAKNASQRWPLQKILIIHRVGSLNLSDQIVLVAVTSAHRTAAFEASQFLMDQLKTRAPFWKKEISISKIDNQIQSKWVEAKSSDEYCATRWNL